MTRVSSAGINPPTAAAPADAQPSPALSPRSEAAGDFSPADLEFAIDNAALRLQTCPPEARSDAWAVLRRLCSMRSLERVREMEEERGLR